MYPRTVVAIELSGNRPQRPDCGRVEDDPQTRVVSALQVFSAPEGDPIAWELEREETGSHWKCATRAITGADFDLLHR